MFDEPDAFDGFDGRLGKFRVAGGEGKGQSVINQIFWFKSMFVDGDVVDAFGNFELFLARFGHAILVDGQYDDGSVVFLSQCKDLFGFLRPGFKVGGVDQAAAGGRLERNLEHVQFGGVDHQWDVHAHFELLDHLAHQFDFVGALSDGGGDVERVRTVFHLLAGDLKDGVVIFLEQQPLELAGTLRVAALADQGWRGILSHGNGRHGGSKFGFSLKRPFDCAQDRSGRVRMVVQFFHQKFQVFGRRPTASAHNRDVVFGDEFVHVVRERFGFERVDGLSVHVER